MGRSYWFECSKCGYRAVVAGRADRSLNAFVQTIVCRDCRKLYDAVVRVRIADEPAAELVSAAARTSRLLVEARSENIAPTFQSVAGRLLYTGSRGFKWMQFKLQCPISFLHRVEAWNDPDKCPRCSVLLERNARPYRIWD